MARRLSIERLVTEEERDLLHTMSGDAGINERTRKRARAILALLDYDDPQLDATLRATEAQRQRAQARLDAGRPAQSKNQPGQFATPPDLARELLASARILLPDGGSVRFLDPAFGTGVFYAAFLEEFGHARQAWAQGFEVDPEVAAIASGLWSRLGLHLHTADFLMATAPDGEDQRATRHRL